MPVSITWLPADRLGELRAFIDDHWRQGHALARDEALLRWQHPPVSAREDAVSVLVAEDQGRLVAMLGFVPFTACLHDRLTRGGWMTNWLVVPDRRGERLGAALVEHVLGREFDVIGALAANAATLRVLGALGFAAQASMPRWIRVSSGAALADLLGAEPDSWDQWRPKPVAPPTGVSAAGAGDLERWDATFRERIAPHFVGGRRDAAFVRRRYVEHPSFTYALLATDGGLAVYRLETVRDSTHRVLRIVEFLAEPAAGERLAAALAEAADQAGVAFADFFCAAERFGEPLERAGFVREEALPTPLPTRFQPLDLGDRPLASSFWGFAPGPDLYVTRGDSDLDRPN